VKSRKRGKSKNFKKKKQSNSIADLQEWQDHLYNPGYWVNRPSPFSFSRLSAKLGCLFWGQAGLVFLGFVALTALNIIENFTRWEVLGGMVVTGIFTVLIVLNALKVSSNDE
jgi:hypothetical protein